MEPMNASSATGWVPQPDGRGTLDILWSCGFTIILCCWSSLCVNIPAPNESRAQRLLDKFNLACIGILGPEFLFTLALGQWGSARRSIHDFHSAGHTGWTMVHAYFADMGGFVLQPQGWERFPLDAKQLHYLVTRGYIRYPTIEAADIDDKNKVDGLTRIITVLQGLWFSINCIGRAVQGLALTTIELTTVAFIFCMIGTSLCWKDKPTAITKPIILECEIPISEILIKAGNAAKEPYRNTPLDFVSRDEWSISLLWAHDLNILRRVHVYFFAQPMKVRPVNKIPNDNWPKLGLSLAALSVLFCLVYSAIFLCAWKFYFPSTVESILWRIASVGTTALVVVSSPLEYYLFRAPRALGGQIEPYGSRGDIESYDQKLHPSRQGRRKVGKLWRMLARWRNNSPDRDPALEIPLRALVPFTVICAAYSVFRIYILIEDVIALRSLPPSAFETVNWSQYLPHI